MRDRKFYARVSATDQAGRKRDLFRALEGVATVPAAKLALRKLQDETSASPVPVAGLCPTFKDYAQRYLAEVSTTKRQGTQCNPSPQSGEKDIAAKTFRESLRLACAHAGVPKLVGKPTLEILKLVQGTMDDVIRIFHENTQRWIDTPPPAEKAPTRRP